MQPLKSLLDAGDGSGAADLARRLARAASAELECELCGVLVVEGQEVRPWAIAGSGWKDGSAETAGLVLPGQDAAALSARLDSADPASWPAFLLERGARSGMAAAIEAPGWPPMVLFAHTASERRRRHEDRLWMDAAALVAGQTLRALRAGDERDRAVAGLERRAGDGLRLAALDEAGLLPMAEWTTDGRITHANKAWRDLTGVSGDEIAAGSAGWMGQGASASRGLVDEAAVQALVRGMRRVVSYERTLPAAAGRQTSLELTLALLPGRADAGVVAAVDRTSLVRAEAEVAQLRNGLQSGAHDRAALAAQWAMEARRRAAEAAFAAHLERRALAARLRSELLPQLASARQVLERGEQGAASAARLLDQAALSWEDLAQDLSSGGLAGRGLPRALEWLAARLNRREGLSVMLDFGPGAAAASEGERLPAIVFDAVRDVLEHLARRGEARAATLRLAADSGKVRAVIETGEAAASLPPELGERLERLGGRAEAGSAAGRGSRITLHVPRSVEPGAPRPAAAGQAAASGPRRVKVLVAEDHKMVREGLVSLLRDSGDMEAVGEASSGIEALAMARRLRPDVIVMDVNMPMMDGIQATRRIKEEQPDVQVIGLSVHEDQELLRAMSEAGAAAYITKAQAAGTLCDVIREHRPLQPATAP
ncbi:MAG TPA: response regulator [Candidatus Polarisedimenticolia bacterium]|nr:response regulator [Candidatus Polarisedimenticolia bacterium]